MADVAMLDCGPDGSNHAMVPHHGDGYCGNSECEAQCWTHNTDTYHAWFRQLLSDADDKEVVILPSEAAKWLLQWQREEEAEHEAMREEWLERQRFEQELNQRHRVEEAKHKAMAELWKNVHETIERLSTVQGARLYQRPYAGTNAYLNKLHSAPNLARIQDGGLGNSGGTLERDTGTLDFEVGGNSGGLLSPRYESTARQRHMVEVPRRILGCSMPPNRAIPRAQLHTHSSPQARSSSTQPISGTPSTPTAKLRTLQESPAGTGLRARTGTAVPRPPPSQRHSPSPYNSSPPPRDPSRKLYSTTTIGWLTALLAIPMILTLGAAFILGFLESNPTFKSAFPLWLTSGFLYSVNSALTIVLDTYYMLSVTLRERSRKRQLQHDGEGQPQKNEHERPGSFVIAMLCSAFIVLLAMASIFVAVYSQNGSGFVLGFAGALLSYLIYLGMVIANENELCERTREL